MKPGKKPRHIDDDVWSLTKRLTVRQCVGQLVEFNPVTARTRTGRELADLVATGDVGLVKYVPPPDLRRLQDLARGNRQVPLLCVSDYQRGVRVVGPSGFGAPHSWNPTLVEEAARVAAEHMRIAGVSMTFSPVADHAYGLRQGRSQEGGGVESPLLMSRMVAAMVRGFQFAGEIAATVKHIGPYQYTDGPDYTTLPLSQRAFLEDCWPAYEAGLAAGTKAVMMSFADLDGVASHASPYLVGLVKEHAVPGVVFISDFTGINELVEFGVAGNQREAVFLAFTQGNIHVDLNGGVYLQHLADLVESGAVREHDLRVRAAEVIQLKKGLGLLDDPNRHLGGERQEVLTEVVPAYVELARQSIVLLRPKGPKPGLLPIPRKAKVLVTGPLADSRVDWLGDYAGDAKAHLDTVVTPLQGVRAIWPTARFAAGTGFEEVLPDLAPTLRAARDSTHVIACLGERESWSGEAKSRLIAKVPDAQVRFIEALRESAPRVKIIALITAGRALHVPEAIEKCADAIFWVPQLGTFAGLAIADVLSGRANPSGRLACSLPAHDRLTSGFSYRERRNGRPAFSTNPDYDFREPGWNANYLELGDRREPAAFAFGEGYGYTTFEYSKRRLSGKEMSTRRATRLKASVVVTNTGTRAGKETVQLYWHDTVSVCVPRRLELLDFRQLELAVGESGKVTFEITPDALAQYGSDLGEGSLPRPDPHPVFLILARNAGEADRMLREREGLLAFTLVA